jgi:mono/diheme cytochrome c family protein
MIQLSTLQIVTLAAVTSALAACQESSAAPTPKPAPAAPASSAAAAAATSVAAKRSEAELIALGEHLVKAGGCGDCHTPLKMGANGPEPDMTRMLSGHPASMKLPPAPPPSGPWMVSIAATNTAYAGPWGTSFTANLTPDMGTGLGNWSRDTFIQTIRSGRHMGRGRAILPPMPIPAYQNFSDDELGAVFAYLHSIPAIENQVPEPLPPPNAPKPRG